MVADLSSFECRRLNTASLSERAQAVALADGEFIQARGRSGSLADRYPLAFDLASGNEIWGVFGLDRELISMTARRRVDWRFDGCDRAGSMIGLVCTHPNWRRRGLAGRILEHLVAAARADGDAFAVLWSGQGEFYQQRGWIAGDPGLLGTLEAAPATGSHHPSPPDTAGIAAAQLIRTAVEPSLVRRTATAWRGCPIPCKSIDLYVEQDGYALVGRADGGLTILFEMLGDPASFETLWDLGVCGAREIYVNSHDGSPLRSWLSTKGLAWARQDLAHWISFTDDFVIPNAEMPWIPYFDRI